MTTDTAMESSASRACKIGVALVAAAVVSLLWALVNPASAAAQGVAEEGEWGPVMDWTVIPIHSIVLPDGKVLSFGTDANGIQGGNFIYNVWDPVTNEVKILSNTVGTNIFCSNMAMDPSTGNILITGGDQYRYGGAQWSGINDAVIFNTETLELEDTAASDMNYARWYGSIMTLPNGELLELGGRDRSFNGSTIPEVYNSETGFRELPGAEITDIADDEGSLRGTYYYNKVFQTSGDDIVVIESEGGGASRADVYRMSVAGEGSLERMGKLPFDTRNLGSGFMYDVDKVVIASNDGWLWTGDLSVDVPTWTKAVPIVDEDNANRTLARTNGTFVPMPDGRIALVGGSNSFGLLADSLADGQKSIMIWDPETDEVNYTAKSDVARTYHSTAQMLADGRIWTGGGGAPGPRNNDNAEVFSPAYLFDDDGSLAQRPLIIDSPTNISRGDTFNVTVDDASQIDMVTVIKQGSATHGSTNDGRVYKLDFSVVDNNTLQVNTPSSNIILPGLWTLYTVTDDGVPSLGSMLGVDMVQLSGSGPINGAETIFYNIDNEQIDGPFELTTDVRFDDVAGRTSQTIFDFGDADGGDGIWAEQVGTTTDLEFVIERNGIEYDLVASDVLTEGTLDQWTFNVNSQGLMRILKNGDKVAEGYGQVPANVQRDNNLIGSSNSSCCHDPLDGLIRNLEIVNLTGLPNTTPIIDTAQTIITGGFSERPDGSPQEGSFSHSAAGTIFFSDADLADTHSITVQPQGPNYLGMFKTGQPSTTDTTSTGDLWWVFSVGDAMIESLAGDQVLTQSYELAISDGRGGVASETVTVTITGENDAPEFDTSTAELTGEIAALAEATPGEGTATLAAGGSVSFLDLDVTDTHTASSTPQGADYVGTLSTGSTQETVTWTFAVNDADLESLAATETVTQTYDVVVADSSGATDTETVTIVIGGPEAGAVNNSPVVDAPASNLAGSIFELEDGGIGENEATLTAVGSVVFFDPNVDDTHVASFTPVGSGYLGALSIGTPTTSSDPGSVSWTYKVADADLDFLGEGDTLTESFTVTIDDGQGLSDVATIVVTLNGAGASEAGPPALTSGEAVTGLSGPLGSETFFTIEVPEDSPALTVQLSGGPDADLYVREGDQPTEALWDCRPYLDGTSNEVCTIANPAAGTWHVMVRGWSAFEDVSLTANAAASPATGGNELTSGVAVTGLSGVQGSEAAYTIEVPVGATNLTVALAGAGDADLYINATTPASITDWDCRPYIDQSSNETCSIDNPTPGTWHVLIRGYDSYAGTTLTANVTDAGVTPPNTSSVLQNGIATGALSGAQGGEIPLTVEVPAGTASLVVTMIGLGDADLYVHEGSAATLTNWDCRPYLDATSNEVCVIDNPAAGTWHVMVHGYAAFSNTRVTADLS